LIFYSGLCKAMGRGRVIGIDIYIRPHNRAAIEAHELFEFITLIEGSSIAPATLEQVRALVRPDETVVVLLDARHRARRAAFLLSVGERRVVYRGHGRHHGASGRGAAHRA